MVRNGDGGLEAASQRLMQAVDKLEAKLRDRPAAPVDTGAGQERDRLAAELGEARERERQLETAAAQASAALGRAAEQIRAAIQQDEEV